MSPEKKKLRILFVCPADVSTAQSFIATVADTGRFEILVFDSGRQGPFPAQKWNFPTISPYRSEHPENGWHRWIGLPSHRFVRFFVQKRTWISAALLRFVIRFYRPDVVHCLGINPESHIYLRSLRGISPKRRPPWALTSWSADVYWDRYKADCLAHLREAFETLGWFLADCRRDLRIAVELGLPSSKLLIQDAVPGVGHVEPEEQERQAANGPLTILVPKAYDGVYHKPHPMLEALSRLRRRGFEFQAQIIGAQEDVRIWWRLRDPESEAAAKFYSSLPRDEYLAMVRKADILLAPSLTDGTPNALLEAMSTGAFPVFSGHESIREWIQDGVNGMLVDPVDCASIEQKLAAVFENRALIGAAAERNRAIVRDRLSKEHIQELLVQGYETLARSRSGGV